MAASPEADRRAAVEMAIKIAAEAVLAHRASIGDAISAVASALAGAEADADATPRHRVEAARQARRRDMLAELERIERGGRCRAAVAIVAKRFSADPRDASEVAALERWLRRHRSRPAK